jgi:hypothetical protein
MPALLFAAAASLLTAATAAPLGMPIERLGTADFSMVQMETTPVGECRCIYPHIAI